MLVLFFILLFIFQCLSDITFSHGRMLKKYQDDPLIMQRVSKYFYSEEVYDDASDKPRLRWRYRNFFTESSSETSHDEKMNNNIKASETSDQKRVHLNRFIQNKKKEQVRF